MRKSRFQKEALARATVGVAFCAMATIAYAVPSYTITDLNTLGGTESKAYGINENGQVAGWARQTTGDYRRAFSWTNGVMTNIGTLSTGNESFAYSINDSGTVVGRSFTSGGSGNLAFTWNGTTPTSLGTLGGSTSEAWGINTSGQIIGQAATNSATRAFRTNPAMSQLGTGTLSQGSNSYAYGINDSGAVVGYATVNNQDNVFHAFRWTGSGNLIDMNTLGGTHSFAYDINASGQIVGGASIAGDIEHAFLYTGGTMNDIGILGGTQAEAWGVNDSGTAVGFSTYGVSSNTHAFVYLSGSGMLDLNTLVPGGSGWVLEDARDINNAGQIVGWGQFGGHTRAFLLTPVPPTPTWNNPAGGLWTTASNWTPTSVPAISGTALFNLGSVGGYTVTLGAPQQIGNLTFQNDKVTLGLAGNTLTASGVVTLGGSAAGQTGNLTVANGTLAAATINVGSSGGGAGILSVSSGTVNATSTLNVGDPSGAAGTLTASNSTISAATLNVGALTAGAASVSATNVFVFVTNLNIGGSSSGNATFSATGGTITATTAINLGTSSGSATATLGTSAGNTINAATLNVGGSSGGIGTLNADASTINATTLNVGGSSGGTGTLAATNAAINPTTLNVGGSSGGSGTATASGGTIAATTVNIGGSPTDSGGTGSVSMSSAATLTASGSVNLAPAGGQAGNLSITNATISSPSVHVGGSSAGAGGAGTLIVGDGATLTASTLKIWNTSGTQVTLNGGTTSVGSLDTDGTPAHFLGDATTNGWITGTLEVTGSNLLIGNTGPLGPAVTLGTGQTLRVKDASNVMLVEPGASLAFTGGKLDITDKKVIFNSADAGTWDGTAYTGVAALVVAGRNGGTWTGSGIVTSQSNAAGATYNTLAVAQASDVRPNTASETGLWAGQTITGTDTLVMYTYGGDATLDGKINIDDYVRIDSGISAGLTGWSNGDFNYDGKVNIDDYTTVIDANIGNQSGVFPTGGGIGRGVVAVPEPAALSLLLALGLPLRGFSRRRLRRLRAG